MAGPLPVMGRVNGETVGILARRLGIHLHVAVQGQKASAGVCRRAGSADREARL
ncbi:hypothetical protein [Streptomyces lincolnensis]|uniref:hypothetical protein n=1 Tax=Streptomyces lincolnensis TaxID=1915 RepID=UPI0037D2F1BE